MWTSSFLFFISICLMKKYEVAMFPMSFKFFM